MRDAVTHGAADECIFDSIAEIGLTRRSYPRKG
jgi:hypothetical protein